MVSPEFKPRQGGKEQDGAGPDSSLAVPVSDEAWPLACGPLAAYDSLCLHGPVLCTLGTRVHASSFTCLPLPSLALGLLTFPLEYI